MSDEEELQAMLDETVREQRLAAQQELAETEAANYARTHATIEQQDDQDLIPQDDPEE